MQRQHKSLRFCFCSRTKKLSDGGMQKHLASRTATRNAFSDDVNQQQKNETGPGFHVNTNGKGDKAPTGFL